MSYFPGLPPNAEQPPPGVNPLYLPYYRCSLAEALRRLFAKILVVSGRAGRAEYWWVVLVGFVVNLVLAVVFAAQRAGSILDDRQPGAGLLETVVTGLVSTVITLAMLSLGVRRLHDVNRSGWWLLPGLLLVPVNFVPDSLGSSMTSPFDGAWALLVVVALVILAYGITVFVFTVLGPRPAGVRFDRPEDASRLR